MAEKPLKKRKEKEKAPEAVEQQQPMTTKSGQKLQTAKPQQQQQAVRPAQQKGKENSIWAMVVRREAAQKEKKAAQAATQGKAANAEKKRPPSASKPKNETKARREPKTAAVTVTCPPGQYEETMREARMKINLASLDIKEGVKIRRAITGALIFEVPGKNGNALADKLARNLKKVFAGRDNFRVDRPTKMAEIRLRGLEKSITPLKIATSVALSGGCEVEEIKVGNIQMSPMEWGTAWAKCPLTAANKIAAAERIKIGWAIVGVQLLENRPLSLQQCYKCLEGGHVRQRCPNKEDRSKQCFQCGKEGHEARFCREKAECPICRDKNLPAGHRSGNKACPSIKKETRGLTLNAMSKGS
ncbi:gag-pol polyprotein [Lasius niger]|uniref:Gag-pol polyprotein n=1 Tax=Lasius niger TaxID=67767 RepID=A0A0J7KFS0_LASNI|nr:gag-pol polyprotein [Lasius niger]